MRRLILGVLSSVLAMDISCFAQGNEMTVTARASEETVIEGYADADNTCAPVELPRLSLVKSPEHGIVCYRIEDFEVAGDSGRDQACIGRWIRGISIFYLARPGYSGPDSLRYEAITDRRRDRVTVRVRVLPDAASASNLSVDPGGSSREPAMSIGPIPACVIPVS
ncbi:hypothetical protein TSA1_14070 [Bradyrhizobium nitroreducens]|uniref:Uncharacterized protein n=1 Tax=Bradyrhizobium nitroreducens TaxID=709803 RepID=A0A2M6UAY4_9BRAD|nr:hypothetical protein [Bradyrhizobium nitroreducens]PIT01770.1 hypothetical protein TSA1_14070 [Bradyrhizobium nitroreducens]